MLKSIQKRALGRWQKGSVLIESMVAVVIFSTGVLALVGLQGAMTKNSSDNQYRAQANMIAQSQLANMMTYGASVQEYISVTNTSKVAKQLPNGSVTFSAVKNSMVTVTVKWKVPGGVEHKVEASSYLFDVSDLQT